MEEFLFSDDSNVDTSWPPILCKIARFVRSLILALREIEVRSSK